MCKNAITFLLVALLASGNLLPNDGTTIFDITSDELESALLGGKPMIVYLGFEGCPWCQEALPIIKRVAEKEKVSIYYFDTDLESNIECYNSICRIICEQNNLEYILVPLVLAIDKEGSISSIHMGTVENHNAIKEKMSNEQVNELEAIYTGLISSWKQKL